MNNNKLMYRINSYLKVNSINKKVGKNTNRLMLVNNSSELITLECIQYSGNKTALLLYTEVKPGMRDDELLAFNQNYSRNNGCFLSKIDNNDVRFNKVVLFKDEKNFIRDIMDEFYTTLKNVRELFR